MPRIWSLYSTKTSSGKHRAQSLSALRTKFGNREWRHSYSPAKAKQKCKDPLKRLQTDQIGLYNSIGPILADHHHVALRSKINKRRQLGKLVSRKRVHEPSAERMWFKPVTAIQTEYSLMQRDPKRTAYSQLVRNWESACPMGSCWTSILSENRCPNEVRSLNGHQISVPRFLPSIAANMPSISQAFCREKRHPGSNFTGLLFAQKPFIVPIPLAISITSTRMEAINVS